jgi:signal transduction histidine kinase
MSHEIRTPMNGILGFSQLLCEPEVSEKERIDYAGVIDKSCHRLINTITDMLEISLIDTNQMDVKLSAFNINNMMNDLYESCHLSFREKNIDFKVNVDSELQSITIVSDEEKIYKTLDKLLNNALTFTREGKVEFGITVKNSDLEFYVKDTGIGISKEFQESIFGRFAQEDISISRDHEGSGLGLSIAKGLVELLGGRIWAESEVGKGSTFYFTLPNKH